MAQNYFSDSDVGFGSAGAQEKPLANKRAPLSDSDVGFEEEAPARGFKGWAQDIGATALKGAIGVPEALVGLADIPTGGAVGKFLENEGGAIGFRPKQAKEIASDWNSDATKLAQQKFQAAEGIGGKLQAAIENPSIIATSIGESLPSMGAGGVAARGILGATRLGAMGAKGAAIAGAAGEGAMMAGSQAEAIRQETDDGYLTPGQSALAAGTGLIGGVVGAASGRLANKLGIGDVDTMVAQGAKALKPVTPLVQQQAIKSIPKQIIQGAITEGFLEELPQSVAEQVLQNIALGKDWHQDVDAAVVLGTLSGGAMGGGAAGFKGYMDRGTTGPTPVTPPKPGLDRVRQEYEARLAQLAQEESGEPQVPQTTPPNGRAVLDAQAAQAKAAKDAQTAANRAVMTPDDEIFQSTGAATPRSVQMGLNPAKGAMSAAAAVAVDTGAADQVQQQAALEQAAQADGDTTGVPVVDYADLDDASRAEVDDYYRRMDEETKDFIAMGLEDDDGIPDFDAPGNATTEDFLRQLGASEQEIQDAISTTGAPQGALQGASGNGPLAPDDTGSTQQGAGADQTQGQTQGLTTTGEPTNGTTPAQAVEATPQGQEVQPAPANLKPPRGILAKKAEADAARAASTTNVQDAPQQPTGTEAQAAPVEAPAPEGGNAAAAGAGAAAGQDSGVRADGVGKKQAFNIGGRDPHTLTFEHKDDGRLIRTRTYPDGQSNTETLATDRNGDESWVSKSAYEKGEFYPAQLSGEDANTAIRDDISGKAVVPAAPGAGDVQADGVKRSKNGYAEVRLNGKKHVVTPYDDYFVIRDADGLLVRDEENKTLKFKSEPDAIQHAERNAKPKTESDAIAEAAHQAATSPKNDLPQPTEAQKEAGNYSKGHITINGLDITIENPAGSKRRPEWPALKNHYGYFKGSVGADKDHVDLFMTDRAGDASLPVFVVDQTNRDGTFDEHKVIMGTADEAEARATYLQNYEKGWTGLGAITQMTQDEFKAWVRDPAKTKKPVALKRGVLAKMAAKKQPKPEPTAKAPPAEPVKPEPAPQPKVEKPAEDDAFMGAKKDEPRNLVAMHNLTAENLLYADSMGGIPVPSIGITKIDTPFSGFGDVTLIAPSSMVDPEQGTPVFDRDAWTARFPTMNFKKVKAKVADAFYERMKPARQMGDDGDSFTSLLWEQLRNANVQSPDKVADLFRRYNAAKLFYAKEVLGKDIKVPMKSAPLSSPAANDKQLQAYWKKNGQRLVEIDRELSGFEFSNSPEYKAFIAEVEGAVRRYAESTGRPERADSYVSMFLPDGSLGPGGFRNLKDDFDKVGEKVVDGIKFNELIRKAVPDNDQAYQAWVKSLVEPLFETPTITVRGREVAPTLDNIVESMTIGATQGAEKSLTFGPGKTAAMLGKRFKSMAEIKAARDQVVSQAAEADGKKATEAILDEYRTRVASSYKYTDWRGNIDTWAANDAAMEALAKAGKAGGSNADIRQALVRAGFKLADQTTIDLASQSIKALRNAATDYFEAKPQRAVKLNEFRGAVIPKGASQEVKDTLTKNGIEFIEFNKSADGARDSAIQKMARRVDKAAKDILFAGAKAKQAQGTPTDRAVMAMAGEGKSADEILRFIANASKSPFNRQIANLLRRTKANPAVSIGGDMGGGAGFKFLAKYSRKNHEVTLSEGAAGKAEQILLHEMVHAATLLALDRDGEHAARMNALYESVKAQGLSDAYGMKNVGEFVAEAFTNPEFQKVLKGYKAPGGTAWDRFVAAVRRILGLSDQSQDALSAALELGVEVMRENVPLRKARSFSAEDAPEYFGMADAASLKQSALDQIHQALSHPGKVSVWDKTIGTMRNLAERAPAFKPVFEAAQRFLDDVSLLANETADVAPRLLPRVESWRDLTKKPVSAEDNKAISKPIFEGTLMWARDTDGKPVLVDDMAKKYADLSTEKRAKMLMAAGRLDDRVLRMWQGLPSDQFDAMVNSRFESQMLKAGVVWKDAELKSLFNLSDNQISLYREARQAIDRSIDLTARADMLRAVGTGYASMRDAVLELPTLADARDLLVETLHADALDNEDQADRLMGMVNTIADRFEKATELSASGYAPLSRFGRYTLDVVDAAGERQYFGLYETMRDANLAKLQMAGAFPGATITQGTMSAEAYKLFAGITPESLELFGNMLGLDAEGGDARDKAFQEYLKLSKNNHSALKRLMHRKGIAGYSEDVGRVLASFVYSNARQAAGGLNAGTIEEAVNAIPKNQGELKDVAMGLRDYVRDPQEEGQAIRGMLFAQYLGGSLASAFVNTTQPFAVTLPWLSQFGGMKVAGKHLAKALKDMAGKGAYEADLKTALDRAEEDGVVSPQEIHMLMAQARGAGGLRSGDGTRAGNARAAASNAWERTKVAWGQPFALAEQFNRRSTFIAAYRLAKERGMQSPAEFARRAVLETQFLYSKANKPRWARGAVGGTLFTFKTYSVSYLELLNRMWTQGGPEGKRAVGWAMVMLMLMGGAGGLPFLEDLEDLIDGIAQMMGYNLSAKRWRQEAIAQIVGKELGEFVNSGLSGLPGAPIDVSGRLGMGDLIPGTGLLLTKQNRERDLMEIVGPAGDLVSRGFKGARKALSGDIGGAALELSPTAVRNAAKGIDMAASGMYKDTKGYKVMDTTLAEAAAKLVGFQPRSVAKDSEATGFKMRTKSYYIQQSSEIKAQWADALFRKDEGALQDVRERLADWNRKNPDLPIVVKMPDVWKRVREMGKDRGQRIADTAPKALRQEMRELARDN